MINPDLPINKAEDDKLNRSSFAETLAQTLLDCSFPSSFTFGLYGAWGSGKTSLLNMVMEFVNKSNEEVVTFNFNPWLCSDAKQLVSQFFKQLAAEIKLKKPKAEQIWSLIDQYGDLFDATSIVPGVGSVLTAVGRSIVKKAGKHVKKRKEDLQFRKDEIIKELKQNNLKMIVSIDDIDRLSNEEIISVFQLVKALADFPNTIYILAFDYEVVVRALRNVQGGNGKEYLEKIIQVPFEIPASSLDTITDILFSKLNDILADISDDRWDGETWSGLFRYGMKEYFTSIRDVLRFTNVFQLKYTLLKDETNPVDLLGITCLQVFEPFIFSKLKFCKDVLCGGTQYISSDREKAVKEKVLAAAEYLVPENTNSDGNDAVTNPDAAKGVLSVLFPKFRDAVRASYVYVKTYSQKEFLADKKISAPECFERYFSLSLENDAIPSSMLRNLIYESNEEEFSEGLRQVCKEGKVRRLLEEIEGCANQEKEDTIPTDRIFLIIKCFTRNWDCFVEEEKTFIQEPLQWAVVRCSIMLLKAIEPSEKFDFLRLIFKDKEDPLTALAMLLSGLEAENGIDNEGKTSKEDESDSSQDILALEQIFKDRAIAEIDPRTAFVKYKDLGFWRELEKVAPGYLEEKKKLMIQDDTSLIKLLTICSNTGMAVTGRSPHKTRNINFETLSKFVDIDDAYQRVKSFQSTEQFSCLPEEDQLSAKTFLYEMENDIDRDFGVNEDLLLKNDKNDKTDR